MDFGRGFAWGAAAAAYQVEGAWDADGKGPSVWDAMCAWEGKVDRGETGKVACDHYHRYAEDVDLMAQIGLQAYRLSISWPRVMPQGTGSVNPAGLDFYDRLIDALLAKGIQPWVTLFHWDYPLALFHRGGWLNPDSPKWFGDYAAVIASRLGDRVGHWMTQNEPQCYLGFGHHTGRQAPGLKLAFRDVLIATHHSLLAHGLAVQALRSGCGRPVLIGAAPVGRIGIPATESAEDIAAAREYTWGFDPQSLWTHSWYSDPMILGHYPKEGMEAFAPDLPAFHHADMATICQPLDFFGFNCYNGNYLQRDPQTGGFKDVPVAEGAPRTSMEWSVTPEVLNWGPRFLYERYQFPIVVTENGMANNDWVAIDGNVHDPQRIDFLQRYLREYHKAIVAGVPCMGYFQWSIMDNFEWAEGCRKRFGLIHVDYDSLKRTPKASAWWYRDVIASNGSSLL